MSVEAIGRKRKDLKAHDRIPYRCPSCGEDKEAPDWADLPKKLKKDRKKPFNPCDTQAWRKRESGNTRCRKCRERERGSSALRKRQ